MNVFFFYMCHTLAGIEEEKESRRLFTLRVLDLLSHFSKEFKHYFTTPKDPPNGNEIDPQFVSEKSTSPSLEENKIDWECK